MSTTNGTFVPLDPVDGVAQTHANRTWHQPLVTGLAPEEAARRARAEFNNLDIALQLTDAGLYVFPAEVRRYGDRWLKKPLIDGWRTKATTDAEQIRLWWKRFQLAVPGIELDRSNLVVIDADRHGGPDGVLAFDNLVSERCGRLPAHPTSLTPGNGQHHYFRQRNDRRFRNRRGSLPAGIDVRGVGGWIVAPGALRSDGRCYEHAPGEPTLVQAYKNNTIPDVPGWLLGIIYTKHEPPGPNTQHPKASAHSSNSSSSSNREAAYARKALDGAAQDLRTTPPGRRNQALNGAAYHMARMVAREWIDQTEVVDELSKAAIASGLDVDEVQGTLGSGLSAGLQRPAEDLVDRPSASGNGSFGDAETSWSEREKKQAEGSKTPNSPKTPTPEARHIRLVRGERARVTDEATAILRERGDIFERGGELVRIAADGIEPVADDWLLDYYDRHVKFNDFVDEPRDAPQWLGRRIMAKRGERGLRVLRAVITAPTMRADGTLLAKPGYDLATGLLLVAASQRPLVPDRPSIAELKSAAATLWRPFADFPFVDTTARSVMLAAILTAVIRQTLGLAPAFSFDAPTAGTGKSLLGFCLLAVCGMERQAIPDCRDEEEIRKRLLSTLRSGLPGVLFDNIRGQFGSAALEAMLTTEQYTDRLLGGSRMLTLPTAVLVLFSGNNFRPAGDLWRRLLTARIDAGIEAPERRSFDIEPFDHCRDHRQEMVAAALTLLRGFVVAGSPRTTKDKLASFEAWDARVRQAVIWIGSNGLMPNGASVADPVNSIERAKLDEPERQKLAAILLAAHGSMGDRKWRTVELIEKSSEAVLTPTTASEAVKALRATIEEVAGEHGKINSRIFGRWIEKQQNRRCGGLWLERCGERWKTALWRVHGKPDLAPEYE